jgi:hypothetical protein
MQVAATLSLRNSSHRLTFTFKNAFLKVKVNLKELFLYLTFQSLTKYNVN